MSKKVKAVAKILPAQNPILGRYDVVEVDIQRAPWEIKEAWEALYWDPPRRGYSKFPYKGDHPDGADEEYEIVWKWFCSLDARLSEIDPRYSTKEHKPIPHPTWVIVHYDW